MTAARQLPLPLPARTALGREDFFVSPANAMAVAMIEGWQDWASRKCVLTGPEGAGKTHLAHVWAAQSGARIVAAADLPDADIPALATGCVCIEDVDRVAGDMAAERALFHLHNLVLAEGHALLLTARAAPWHWPLALPDLKSRVQGTQAAALPEPDDALLAALLAKLFGDRQIVPAPDVIPYLLGRMPRSYRAAQRIVAALDREALARKGAVTRPLAARVMEALEEEDGDDAS
jgi:chromosomal replication initiation ATPase DnaA